MLPMAPATDGLASSQRPVMRGQVRVRVTQGLDGTTGGAQLLATGTGKAVRTAAVPARAGLVETERRVLRGASPEARGPRVMGIASRQSHHWGQASLAWRAGRAVEQAVPEDTFTLGRPVRDGGGSHRRSRSGRTVSLVNVATKTPVTRAPLRARRHEGKEQLPHALVLPCSGARRHWQLTRSGVVCSLMAAGGTVTTRRTHAAARISHTTTQLLPKTSTDEETHVQTFTIEDVWPIASTQQRALGAA